MHGIDVARTLERFEDRERWRSKIGYLQTMQGAALDRECKLLSRLADEIRAQVAGSTDDWILVLEKCDFDVLALVTLDTLFHSILRRYKGHKACIRLGRAAHDEAWATKLLIDDEALHRRIGKIHDARGRAAAA